ncbi:uncharacterized protein LOC100499182 isoform X2 [Nasonia vitripennis]|uniref:G-patch domain-containing protein n=1 Tax=Nasonia vitripennis TaxID=7425 RepID=A0A7M7TA04_NASVI|nr:uncharacterized protein LOC100499182 isoform X2 [Nasonia vitripennis]XP_031785969.1 uncharacterized protein LOC100499182 isoform X2 [Nasonia vitripennis]XP_032457938.1 uncharacterized protein LOC100499182 isoform X2 [Nasonia vitripennis]
MKMDHNKIDILDVTDMGNSKVLIKFKGQKEDAMNSFMTHGPCVIAFTPTATPNMYIANIEYAKEENKIRVIKTYTKSKSQSIMEKMGYIEGKGLGKDLQGRTDPVKAVPNEYRQGLGATNLNYYSVHNDTNFVIEQEQGPPTIIEEPGEVMRVSKISEKSISISIRGNPDDIKANLKQFGPCEIEKVYTDQQGHTKLVVRYQIPLHNKKAVEYATAIIKKKP